MSMSPGTAVAKAVGAARMVHGGLTDNGDGRNEVNVAYFTHLVERWSDLIGVGRCEWSLLGSANAARFVVRKEGRRARKVELR